MPGRRPLAVLALLLASPLLAACTEPAEPDGDAADPAADEGRTSRGGRESSEDDGRNVTQLGTQSGSMAGPGRYPFTIDVPPGGATAVEWVLSVVPLASLTGDGIEGPGCQMTGWYSGITESGVAGWCADLDPGTHELAAVLSEPVLEYHAEVQGRVLGGPPGATET